MALKSEWLADINDMHYKFGATEWVENMHRSKNYKVLKDFQHSDQIFLKKNSKKLKQLSLRMITKEVVDWIN